MAKKVYLYNSFGYDFLTCDFDGLDVEGKPRLTIMTPGQSVENFKDYLEFMLEEPGDYHLLCEEDKPADSKLVFEMLGQILLYSPRPLERISERLEEMRKCGINFDRELQRVKVRIFEYDDEEKKRKSYRLEMYVGDRFVGEDCYNKDAKDIIIKLSEFFFFIENHLHIPLKKHLKTSESLKKLVMRYTPDLFDEIEIN